MIWIDYAIIGLIAISATIGLFRGFVKEALSLTTWGLAFWIGLSFSREFSVYLKPVIDLPSARMAASFVILFLLTLILGSMLVFLLGQLVDKTGLTGSDRFAGLLFGIGRGIVVVAVLVLLAGLTPLPDDPWWKDSRLITPFQTVALWLRDQLPTGIAGKVDY